MDTPSAIESCKATILPLCEEAARRLMCELPAVRAFAFDGLVGSLTAYNGYHCGLECIFENVPAGEEDLLALTVDIGNRDGSPLLSADVCWGRGQLVAEQFDGRVPLSEAAIAAVIEGFPRLNAALVAAARAKVCPDRAERSIASSASPAIADADAGDPSPDGPGIAENP
jgi:hypothetical protein